jgi:hypothetical protein
MCSVKFHIAVSFSFSDLASLCHSYELHTSRVGNLNVGKAGRLDGIEGGQLDGTDMDVLTSLNM